MADTQSTISYVDPYRDSRGMAPLSQQERAVLRAVNQRIAAKPGLAAVIDYLFEETQALIPCDRISVAFVEEDGERVTSQFTRAAYEPLLLRTGYSGDLNGSSLGEVLRSGIPRIISDLERYQAEHPRSRSTRLLLKEGVRSSLTCPLEVEGRVLGFMFRSSRQPGVYTRRHVELQVSIAERLSQAVEKAWRIEQLQQANRAYFELLGFVAHELKSPVASLVMDARLLSQGYLGELEPQQQAKIERMAQKGEYLVDLIREYLDLSQLESGDLVLHLQHNVPFEDNVISPTLELLRTQIEAASMRLTTDFPLTPTLVECDPGLLRIAVANFISNAVKYGNPDGALRVTVTSAPDQVRASVWNEGPGFPPEQRHQLFRKFSRLATPELKGRKGTGLGLYNTWRIIRLHGGRVTAESKPGAWAEFTFTIPQPIGPLEEP